MNVSILDTIDVLDMGDASDNMNTFYIVDTLYTVDIWRWTIEYKTQTLTQ